MNRDRTALPLNHLPRAETPPGHGVDVDPVSGGVPRGHTLPSVRREWSREASRAGWRSTPTTDRGNEDRCAWQRAHLAATLTGTLAVLYGFVQTLLLLLPPRAPLSARGPDLVLVSGWWSVGLCALAATLAGAMLVRLQHPVARHAVAAGAVVTGGLLVLAAALIWWDVVAFLLPGLGVSTFPLGAASRVCCLALAGTLLVAARLWVIATGPGCRRCGRILRSNHRPRPGDTSPFRDSAPAPSWAYAAVSLAVAGFLTRVLADSAVGFDSGRVRPGAPSATLELYLAGAGLLLPLALVYSWGRRWPCWVPGMAGRPVARWLVLAPAVTASLGLLTYYGHLVVGMLVDRATGLPPVAAAPEVPETFLWVSVLASLAWGAGLAVATCSYHHRTRPPCRTCGG